MGGNVRVWEGNPVGSGVSAWVGKPEDFELGMEVGFSVGDNVGTMVGSVVGKSVKVGTGVG